MRSKADGQFKRRLWTVPVPLLALVTFLFVAIAYQTRRPVEIDMGSGLGSVLFVDNFQDAEGSYRWSRARSCVVFPDLGGGISGRVEMEISAFRPKGVSAPIAVLEAGRARQREELSRGLHRLSLPMLTRGFWSSDLTACVRSETFQPGSSDERQLGVRVHRARWVAEPGGLTLPPLRQLLLSCLVVLFTWGILGRTGLPSRPALAGGVVTAVVVASAYVWLRHFAAVLSLPMAIALGAGFAALRFAPHLSFAALRYFSLSARSWLRGLRLAIGWPSLGLLLFGVVLVTSAYLARSVVRLDMGSGKEAFLARRFASFDSDAGVRFRRALQGAELDLRDFGGGDEWKIAVTASLPDGGGRTLALARAGGVETSIPLGGHWTTGRLEVKAPWGWSSGLLLEFPTTGLRVDKVEVDRGRALPSLRVLVAALGAALAFAIIAGASGLGEPAAFAAAAVLLVLESLAIYTEPVLSIPFVSVFAAICTGASFVAALGGGLLAWMRSKSVPFDEGPMVVTTVSVGFVVWLAALSFPLYHGLHFVYHSNIAEEIWKGKFFVFYLPNPGNILSREAQWNGLVVPYSCLYHTIVAPLSALPAFWFQQTHKIFQAALLASTALVGALGAFKLVGGKSSVWTALLLISLPSTFQLLGLGHFPAVFGCWASTLALVYLIFSWGKLDQRPRWLGGVALLTLAFLSYAASLLFTGFTLAVALPVLARFDRLQARRLITMGLAATGASLLLYYGYWVLPFLRESIPILIASEGKETVPIASRLALIPRKLDYSFGSATLPVVGLAGVWFVTVRSRLEARFLLTAWASVLVIFSFADIYFNFLLKHHYFTMVPIAIGAAALLESFRRRGGWMKWVSYAALVYALTLGMRAAASLAMGTMR